MTFAQSNYPSNGGWQLVLDNSNFNVWNGNPLINLDEWNEVRDGTGHRDYDCNNQANLTSTNLIPDYDYSTNTNSLGLVSQYNFTPMYDYAECGNSYNASDGLPNFRSFNYSGSVIASKKSYLYGKFEIKFKITNSASYHPVFWLHYADQSTGEYREIDVCEFNTDDINSLPMHLHTNNPNTPNGNECDLTKQGTWWSDDWIWVGGYWIKFDFSTWNTITLYWEPNRLEIAVNGLSVWNIDTQNDEMKFKDCGHWSWSCLCSTCTKFPLSDLPFDKPMNVVLSNSIMQNHSNHDINMFDIEHIRIWQRLDCNQDLNVNNVSQWATGNYEYMGRNVNFNAPTNKYDAFGNDIGCYLCPWDPICTTTGENYGQSHFIDAYYTDSWHATNEFQTHNQVNGMNLRLHQVPCTPYSQYRISKHNDDEPSTDINLLKSQWDAAGIKYTIRNTPPPSKDTNNLFANVNSQIKLNIFPNPFSQSSTIELVLAKASNVEINMVNTLGQTVQTILPMQPMEAGSHQYSINRNNLVAGVYLLEIKTDNETVHKQVVIQ